MTKIKVSVDLEGLGVYEIGSIEAKDDKGAREALAELLSAVADNLRAGFEIETVVQFHARRTELGL